MSRRNIITDRERTLSDKKRAGPQQFKQAGPGQIRKLQLLVSKLNTEVN